MKIALGVFDGLHRGHQKVIEKAHRVITFDPHPNSGVHLLTTIKERQDLIGNLDIIKFNNKLTQMSPEDFIERVIIKKYHPETIIVGHDFAFGYNREGNVEILRELGKKYNFTVEEVAEYVLDEHPVRSSSIRKLLAKGDVKTANKYLGREYQLSGKIIHGDGRGTKLGFPTINIQPDHPNKLIPLEGIYGGTVMLNRKLYKAAIFIGERKTFNGTEKVIEAHILDFTGDVYGKTCTLFFNKYIRAEKKFKNSAELVEQIKKDLAAIL